MIGKTRMVLLPLSQKAHRRICHDLSSGKGRFEGRQVAELERKVGRQAMEIDFLQRRLQHVEEQRKLQALMTTHSWSTSTSRKK